MRTLFFCYFFMPVMVWAELKLFFCLQRVRFMSPLLPTKRSP